MALPETIAPALFRALEAKGYQDLTPVQSAMLEEGVGSSDLLVSAQTGSGKTVAFGMAIADNLLGGKEMLGMAVQPMALIVAPTRELALQVRRELEWLYAGANAKLASCVGGMEMRKEIRALQQGAHIVVGTPGRLRDHITRGSLDLENIKAVVLDEADEMLDLGFREDLEFILDAAPKSRRTLMFSATVPAQIAKLAGKFQKDAMRIATVSKERQHADIEYRLMPVAPHERENAIINALLFFDSTSTMVFCATRDGVKHLSSRLANRGFGVVSLSGELSQAERTNALQSMRDGRARVCVATDVAARGIDLPSLDLVIHADLPTNPDTLLHRSGRTGRAGRKGICLLVAPLHRRRSAERLLSLAKVQAATVRAPSQHDIQERDKERMLSSVGGTEGSTDEIDTVAELMKRHSAEAISLAYIRMVQASRPMAEELSESNISDSAAPMASKEAERFGDGVWFRLPQGRKQNVEPRWLIPTLCKAGHLTKRDIGFIRLLDSETRFEVRPEKADSFLEALANAKGSDKGLRVTRFVGDPTVLPPREKSHDGGERPKFDRGEKPKSDYAPKKDYAAKKDYSPKKDYAEKREYAPKKAFEPDAGHAKDHGAIDRPQGDWAPKDSAPKEKQRWSKDQKAARPKADGERPAYAGKSTSDKPRDFEPKKWDKPKPTGDKPFGAKPFKGKPKKSNG